MINNVLSIIEKKQNEFSKGQKRIATFIINHYDKAAYMTAAKLGKAVNVSESTVVRFATEIGFDGYPSLQKALLNLIPKKLTAAQRMEVAAEQMDEEDILEKVLLSDVNNIKTSLSIISKSDFNSAIDTIINSHSIYILGTRSTSVLSGFLHFYFTLMFPHVKLVNPTNDAGMYEQIMRIDDKDVFIAISFPRYAKYTTNAVAYAKSKNAKIIAITDSYDSPIARYADSSLIAKSNMAGFADSLVAPLSIVNAIIAAIGLKKKNEISTTLSTLEDVWETYGIYEKDTITQEI